mgnify:CR=1 FL=1
MLIIPQTEAGSCCAHAVCRADPQRQHMPRTARSIFHVITVAVGALIVPAAAQEVKQRVAIFDFETVGFKSDVGKSITEIFRVSMINTGKYRVVERETLDKVLREQNLQVGSAVIDENSAVKIGKILGAEFIIIGNVVKLGETYTINTRMVDVQTGEVIITAIKTTKGEADQLLGIVREAARDLCLEYLRLRQRK